MATLQERMEALGPMDRVIRMLIDTKDHVFHGRPGVENKGTWRPVNTKDKEEIEAKYKGLDLTTGFDYLVDEKIIVRDRSSIALCEGCLRISIGSPEENATLMEAFDQLI